LNIGSRVGIYRGVFICKVQVSQCRDAGFGIAAKSAISSKEPGDVGHCGTWSRSGSCPEPAEDRTHAGTSAM